MKPYVLTIIFLLLISNKLPAQNHYNVYGSIKESALTPDLFSNFDSTECKPVYERTKRAETRGFWIIDKIVCNQNSYRWYVVLYQNTTYLVDTFYFSDSEKIDSLLDLAKRNTPNINERFSIALQENNRIKKEEELAERKTLDSIQTKLEKSLVIARNKNMIIWNWSWSYGNEYSNFADVSITILNPYKQKIKYLWFTFQAYNAVDDLIKDKFSGKLEKTVKGIGPIEYADKGTYNFENVFYSNVIEYLKIKQIKIQFFDGSVKVINKPISLNAKE